ncbi:hypothetical protein [Pseudoalteromonas marina]|uniref:hypothetical protein n=1 Tax=Pseudoalteromonas marina TaxID=267375 RepID=UPI003C5FD804
MAKTRFVQTSFNSGVLSPLIKGRTEIEQYYKGLEVGKNIVLVPQGGLKRRPGTKFIAKANKVLTRNTTVPTMPNGGTAADINDGFDATSTTTTTNISTIDPYVIAHYDLGTAKAIEFADVRGAFLTASGSSGVTLESSDDDASWTEVRTFNQTLGISAQDMRVRVGLTARYWRLTLIEHADLTTNKVTLEEFNLFEETSTASNVKLKGFSVESDRHYLLVYTDGNLAIYETEFNTRVIDIKTSYTSSQVANIRDAQTESVALIFHEDIEPQRLINLGTDTDWTLDIAPFINIPQFDYNDSLSPAPTNDEQTLTFTGFVAGDTFQMDIEGVFSKNITFAGDSSTDERNATIFNIQKNVQDMPVMGETGVAVTRTGANAYKITSSGESAKDFELFTAFATTGTASKTITVTHDVTGVSRKGDVWSITRGHPKTACFYEGRLVLGGTRSKPQSLFMSKAGSLLDFEIDEGDDDDAIFTTISSRKLNNIVDVFPGRNLQIFTSGSEFTVNVSPVTPSTISITPQTSHGSLNIEAKEVDGSTLFIDRNGKSLKQYLYSFNEDSYTTQDISVLSPELIKSPVDMAILAGTSSDDANWVFIVNNDGSGTILNTLRSQDINGFTEWTTSGFLTDVSAVDDQLYMVNKRQIDGSDAYYIEEWDFNRLLDSSILTSGSISPVAGLDHLEGETVSLVTDGIVLSDRVVSGGSVTLTTEELAASYGQLEVGLKFIPEFSTMPVNTNVGSGQNSMRLKKLVRMNIRVLNTTGLYVEGEPVPVRSLTPDSLGASPNTTTGIIDDVFNLAGWTRESMPVFTCPDPTPMTVLAIEYQIESS